MQQEKKKIKALVFDIGNVIFPVDWSPTISKLNLSGNHNDIIASISNHKAHILFEKGLISKKDFYTNITNLLGPKLSKNDFYAAWNLCLGKTTIETYSLIEIAVKNVPIYALSNTNELHYESFIKDPIFSFFKKLFLSFQMNMRKPEPEIYKKLILELNCDPSEILFIDDSVANIQAATTMGINTKLCLNSTVQLKEILLQYNLL